MRCSPSNRRLREDCVKAKIVVDHADGSGITTYEQYGRADEVADWLRHIAVLIGPMDITP